MLNVPLPVIESYQAGLPVAIAARHAGLPVRSLKRYYRALAFRDAAAAERAREQAERDRAMCLSDSGVYQALVDTDPAGACTDYPVDALRRWGLDGVPASVGVSYD